jgi:hypothetical protein
MTLNRYMLIGKDHTPWLKQFAESDIKLVIRGSLLFSAIFNIGHGFEYKINDIADILNDINSETYDLAYMYPIVSQDLAYFSYSVIYFMVNVVGFVALNTAVEIKIILRMKKELREKRARLAKMREKSNSSAGDTEACKKKEEEDDKKERRVITMVVLNSILNFLLRFPELFVWLESNYHNWFDLAGRISLDGWFSLLSDLSYLTYILTFSTNFVIFYNFNSVLKESINFRSMLKL